jgi:hypothetical protein
MLSIIVPAFNEGSRIYDNLKIISSALSGFTDDYEIIAVNDGSSDNTGDEIRRAASEDSRIIPAGYEQNRGKGGRPGRNGGKPAAGQQAPAAPFDLKELVEKGIIDQETADKIEEYLQNNAPAQPAEGQAPADGTAPAQPAENQAAAEGTTPPRSSGERTDAARNAGRYGAGTSGGADGQAGGGGPSDPGAGGCDQRTERRGRDGSGRL